MSSCLRWCIQRLTRLSVPERDELCVQDLVPALLHAGYGVVTIHSSYMRVNKAGQATICTHHHLHIYLKEYSGIVDIPEHSLVFDKGTLHDINNHPYNLEDLNIVAVHVFFKFKFPELN